MSQSPAEPRTSTELPGEILSVAEQIGSLIRALPATDVPIPGATWTVGEAAAHLATANRLMAEIAAGQPRAYGDGTRAGLAEANAQSLDGYAERDGAVLAGQITGQAAAFVEAAGGRPATDLVATPMGEMPMGVLAGYLLAHQLSHGTAIADAVGHRPLVRPHHVRLVLPFMVATMPRLVDRDVVGDLNARFALRVGHDAVFTIAFVDGAATVSDQPSGRVDCTISADPVSFFLLAAGLRSQWPLIARGRLRAWGRRPWLALRFLGFFAIP